ncbi:MAG: hypothetical protein JKY92_00115 [Magnetovibrio sp.]|nr:hypothetical protein [Magnetovibrio sp.]
MNAQTQTKTEGAVVKQDSLKAGGALSAIVPQTFDDAWRIGRAVSDAGMAPNTLNSPEKCTIAILHGLEVGFTPMAALQSIAVINGKPTIWGDGAMALIQASGLLDGIEEFEKTVDDVRTAICKVKRVGNKKWVERFFSHNDAEAAGLLTKDVWKKYEGRMLQMRARSWALRDVFSDVLKGLKIREEVEDYIDITPENSPPPVTTSPPPAASPPPAPVVTSQNDEPEVEEAEVLELTGAVEIMDRFMSCNDQESLDETQAELTAVIDALNDGEQKAIQKVVDDLKARFEEMEQA